MTEDTARAAPAADELTGEQKRQNVIRLAFGGSEDRYREFVEEVRRSIPSGTGVVLRGSAVTGCRWKDQAPFDADGPGTSDLDLTLVGGDDVIGLYKVTGFFVPGIHSRPLSDDDPEIAPDLIPLRESADEDGRTSGEHPGYPRFRHVPSRRSHRPAVSRADRQRRVPTRVLTYNIRFGGRGRESALAEVIRACEPDIVVLQEATDAGVVERLARDTQMEQWASRPGSSLGFLSRRTVQGFGWHRPRMSRHAFLEIQLPGSEARIFGVHLSAVHAAWTESRRVIELRALLKAIAQHQHGFHVLTGDFNTLAPGELLDFRKLPGRLRALVWLSGGTVRWRTIQIVLDSGYVDGYRAIHPDVPGFSFPTWDPHARLDYLFLPTRYSTRLLSCEVQDGPRVIEASDHLPLLSVVDVPMPVTVA